MKGTFKEQEDIVSVAAPKVQSDYKIPVNLVERIKETTEDVVGLDMVRMLMKY